MLDSYIIWNGVSSATFGLYVKKEPNFNKPKRKHQLYPVLSRNGDYVVLEQNWENIIQEYTLFLRPEETNHTLAELSHLIANWLHSADDYAELSDSYDPDHFRLAYFVDEIDIVNHLNEFGTATIRFNCRPEYFLNSGTEEVTLSLDHSSSSSYYYYITNPTGFWTDPLITIDIPASTEQRNFQITTTAQQSTNYFTVIVPMSASVIRIDSREKTIRRGSSSISANTSRTQEFPKLKKGQTRITLSEAVNSLKIVPRWWEL